MQKKIVSCGVLVLIVVAIHNLCGMGLSLLAAKNISYEYSKATAIAIEESGMQNSGLAVSLTTAKFCDKPAGNTSRSNLRVSGTIFPVPFCAGIRRKG